MDGIGSAVDRVKRLFSRRYSYRYNPHSRTGSVRDFIKANNKPVFILFIVVVLIGSMYIVTNSVTGYVAHTASVEQDLADTKTELETALSEKVECTNDLSVKTNELDVCNQQLGEAVPSLASCEEERTTLEHDYSILAADYSVCESDRVYLEESYQTKSNEYSALVNKSAIICCSIQDVINDVVRDWDIVDGGISCGSGNYKVECGTGETNY